MNFNEILKEHLHYIFLLIIFKLYTCLLILQFPIFLIIFCKHILISFYFFVKKAPKYKFKNRNSKEIVKKVEMNNMKWRV